MMTTIITCPKCGFEQGEKEECSNCGIIFKKVYQKKKISTDGFNEPVGVKQKPSNLFRFTRILLLLLVLFFVCLSTWTTMLRTTSWEKPLRVVIYPVNADNSSASDEYIRSLEEETFDPVEDFMREEAERYGIELEDPVVFIRGPEVDQLPPEPPHGGSIFNVMLWSLRLRWWVYKIDTYDGPAAQVKIFVLYHDPKAFEFLEHSVGIKKGLICVVNAYASWKMREKDNVIIAHELLHTVGATDKYDPSTGFPIFPDGFSEPDKDPLFPQEFAEIMGSRIQISDDSLEMPGSLHQTLVGPVTAQEIKWIEEDGS
jgi:hypothetical protein